MFRLLKPKSLFKPTLFKPSHRLISHRGLINAYSNGRHSLTKPVIQYFHQEESGIIKLIIGINSLVFLGWVWAEKDYATFGSPKSLGFMRDNFSISWSNIMQGKLHTLITSNFSHKDFTHFLINNFILYSFGPAVVSIVGLPAFVPLYIAAGVSSSVFHLAYDRWAKPKLFPHLGRQNVSSLGASGAISGLSIIFALTHPFHTVQLFMIIPLPAIGCVGGFFLYDLYKAFEGRYVNGGTNHIGHVGGAVFGIAYWMMKIRRGGRGPQGGGGRIGRGR